MRLLNLMKKPQFSFKLKTLNLFNKIFYKNLTRNFFSTFLHYGMEKEKFTRRVKLNRRLKIHKYKQLKIFRKKYLIFTKMQSYYGKFLKKEIILLKKKKDSFLKLKNKILKKKNFKF